MKKFVAMLLVLSVVLALAGSAMAACKIKAGMWVEFKKDSPAYTDHKSSAKTKSVVQKKSIAKCDKVCGNYARLIVNWNKETKRWFKICDLKEIKVDKELEEYMTHVVWAKGGKGMSTCTKETWFVERSKGLYTKVTGHTNLRKNNGMKFKSQGVVEKGDLLKLTGWRGWDDRNVPWCQVCKGGKKLWVSWNFIKKDAEGYIIYYNKCGKRVNVE